jgi:hypothetical protein
MTSWLLPGFPHAVHSHDGVPPLDSKESMPDLIRFTPTSNPCQTPPLDASASAPNSRSRSPCDTRERRRRRARRERRDAEVETLSVSVNELFEGLDDAETSASVNGTRDRTAVEVHMNSVSRILARQYGSTQEEDGDEEERLLSCTDRSAVGWPERGGICTDRDAVASTSASKGGAGAAAGGRKEWVEGEEGPPLKPQTAPGTGSSGASSRVKGVHFGEGATETECIGVNGGFEDGDEFDVNVAALPGRGSGELTPQPSPTPHALIDTRWSFENGLSPFVAPHSPEIKLAAGRPPALPAPEAEDSAAALFEKIIGPPLETPSTRRSRAPVSVHVRAGVVSPDPAPPPRKTPRDPGHERQLLEFQAAMRKHDDKAMPPPACPRCAALSGSLCPDCLLAQRSAGKKALRKVAGGAVPRAAHPTAARQWPGRGRRSRREKKGLPVESGLHVQLHMPRLRELPSVGVARRAAMQADAVATGRLLVGAVLGVSSPSLAALQRSIKLRQPLSRDSAWLVLSSEARDLIECLLMEQLSPETALEVCAVLSACFKSCAGCSVSILLSNMTHV